eukprot:3945447-Amphidinium_carterae.1
MFRYAVSDYYSFEGMGNGELVVLERPMDHNACGLAHVVTYHQLELVVKESLQYEISYCWVPGDPKRVGVGGTSRPGGLKRKKHEDDEAHHIWDGNPSSTLIESAPLKSG